MGDLERLRVRYLVLTPPMAGIDEPNDTAVSSGVTILDDYIRAHYRVAVQLGHYGIWQRT